MSKNNQLYCKIWAIEQDPRNGTAHWCHAECNGLKGGLYLRDNIDRVLDEKSTNLETMRWRLVRCEPSQYDLSCNSCKYKPFKGAQGYFH